MPIRSVADTALVGAAFRARETDRPDALLVDPLARRLAGNRGFRLAMGSGLGWVLRTRIIDDLVLREVRQGAGPIVCLGAGFDTRPYRLPIPPTRRWIEVDFPEVIAQKGVHLANIAPACNLIRVGLDLLRRSPRRRLLARLGKVGRPIAVTEGLLVYLTARQVRSLAHDLAAAGFTAWILDLPTPAVLQAQRHSTFGRSLARAHASLRFAPAAGSEFFKRGGWEVVASRSVANVAERFGRLSPRTADWLNSQRLSVHILLLRRSS